MAAPKTTPTREPREYTVSLTEQGAAYVHYYQLGEAAGRAAREEEQIAHERIAAKLAVAAAKLEQTLRMAGDPLARLQCVECGRWATHGDLCEACSHAQQWRQYANLGGNDADRGW